MAKPGKWETHQQLRAKINAEKEASRIVSEPLSSEDDVVVKEELEVVTEVKFEAPNEILEETESNEEIESSEPIQEEPKVELKPISKKKKG